MTTLSDYFKNHTDEQLYEIADRLLVCQNSFKTEKYFLTGEEVDKKVVGLCSMWDYYNGNHFELRALFLDIYNCAYDPFRQFGAGYMEMVLNYPLRAEKCGEMREIVLQYINNR